MLNGVINSLTEYEGLMAELDSTGAVTRARVYDYMSGNFPLTSMACTIGTGKIYIMLYSTQ